MKRFICGILCLCLLWAGFGLAAAEEDNEDPGLIDELIDEENEEMDQGILYDGSKNGNRTSWHVNYRWISGSPFRILPHAIHHR